MRPEERLVLEKDVAGELSSLLASALETKNWTVGALCRIFTSFMMYEKLFFFR